METIEQAIGQEQATKNQKARASVTNEESKAITDKIASLITDIHNVKSPNKAFIVIADLPAEDGDNIKSISSAGASGTPVDLVKLIVDAMKHSDHIRRIILSAAMSYDVLKSAGVINKQSN